MNKEFGRDMCRFDGSKTRQKFFSSLPINTSLSEKENRKNQKKCSN
jgi:hypothetical protein